MKETFVSQQTYTHQLNFLYPVINHKGLAESYKKYKDSSQYLFREMFQVHS